jgi:hypothetical protein
MYRPEKDPGAAFQTAAGRSSVAVRERAVIIGSYELLLFITLLPTMPPDRAAGRQHG